MAGWKNQAGRPIVSTGQAELYPLTLDAIVSDPVNGQHLYLVGECAGARFYCKRDSDGRPVRATEWICGSLASHLGLSVPDFAPVLNPESGEILFGSKGEWGTAPEFEAKTFLTTPQISDIAISSESSWLGSYLSRVYAFDMFVGNPDRQFCNFLLVRGSGHRTLLVFDHASANLKNLTDDNFPIADTPTVSVGKMLRQLHGFDQDAAMEMLNNIGAVPAGKILSICEGLPEEWLSEKQKGKIVDGWSDGTIGDRLAALRSGLIDGSLL